MQEIRNILTAVYDALKEKGIGLRHKREQPGSNPPQTLAGQVVPEP